MRIGILGRGTVGQTIAGRLTELGHDVRTGGRGDFAAVADHGELCLLCVAGEGAVSAVEEAGQALDGKVLVDVSNPLAFAEGGPPTLFTGHDQSLGEQVQAAVPGARVVKSLNTVTADVMVHPDLVEGDHVIFVCGDDADAKATVSELLGAIGWPAARVRDLGGLDAARAQEAYVLLWVRLMGAEGGPVFNIAVQKAAA